MKGKGNLQREGEKCVLYRFMSQEQEEILVAACIKDNWIL
jgi:hypothetical protein